MALKWKSGDIRKEKEVPIEYNKVKFASAGAKL